MHTNSSARYYQKNKEKLQKVVSRRYQNLSVEEKEKMHQYGSERYKFLPGHKNQKLVEYRKKYYEIRKGFIQQLFKPLIKPLVLVSKFFKLLKTITL